MSTMTAEEIRLGLFENSDAPYGPARTARAEALGAAAEASGDSVLFRQSLMGLIDAYEHSAERTRILVPFARLLQEYDRDPAAFTSWEVHSLFWRFKWVTGGILDSPDIPLAAVERWLTDMERRYRLAGHSERAVRQAEQLLAEAIGDQERTDRAFAAWLAAGRDSMSDCHACELNDQGRYRAVRGDDAGAIRLWGPVLAGDEDCLEEPHRVLAHSLLPLLRLGRADEARANHLRGYRMARGNESLLRSIGAHIEFCALTGNESRGLEILAEHAGHLGALVDVDAQLDFDGGILVLLRRLKDTGHGDRPTVPHEGAVRTAAELYDLLYADAAAIAARFDARNGNSLKSDRFAERIARQPLADVLPLGVRSPALPAPAAPDRVTAAPAGGDGAAPSFADLVERARTARRRGHPSARALWTDVARRAGADTAADPELAADLLEFGAWSAYEDGAADAAERFARAAAAQREAGSPSRAAYADLAAAGSAARAGAPASEITERLAAAVRSAADLDASDPMRERRTALAGLAALRLESLLRHREQHTSEDGSGEGAEQVDTVLREQLDAFVADRSKDRAVAAPGGTTDVLAQAELFLAQVLLPAGEQDRAVELLASSAEHFLAAGRPWEAARPLELRARVVAAGGDPEAAEADVRAALAHSAEVVEPDVLGSVRLTLSEVLMEREGAAAEAAEHALGAAHWFDRAGLSTGPGARARLLLARAYADTDRPAEAAEVLHSALPDLVETYGGAGGEEVVRARRLLGSLLSQLDDPRGAAEQYLLAAEGTTAWEDPRPQASLAHSAAECLGEAELTDEAKAAYMRALELWRRAGDCVVSEVRVLRSLAWLGLRYDSPPEEYERARRFMGEALALVQDSEAAELRYEWAETCSQLARLLDAETPDDGEERSVAPAAAGEVPTVPDRDITLLDRAAGLFSEFGAAARHDRFNVLARAAWTEYNRNRVDTAKARMTALVTELEEAEREGEETAELLEQAREMLDEME
ncbi:tetratricopeptide repeat protein [Streptomyces sp. NPDC094448]|uniref:tetratricopeptide repeat protein n=1 Tax=Streptomyces sp. NPDC094448 TaxID=3366063 RepID=UPI0037FEF907